MRPHQQRFIARFMAPQARRVVTLTAPIGFGKHGAIYELVRRFLAMGESARVLILGPRQLAEQYLYRLRHVGVPCLCLDRYSFRTLVDLGGCAKALPARCAVFAGYEFARLPDVVSDLATVPWVLVVGDEAHRLDGETTGAAFIRILESSGRVLLTTGVRGWIADALIASTGEAVEWKESDLELEPGQDQSFIRIRTYRRHFKRTAEELAIVAKCWDFTAKLVRLGANPAVPQWLARRVTTGAPIAGERLDRWERVGVQLARRRDEIEDATEEEVQSVESEPSRLVLTQELLNELRDIRVQIAAAAVDSRLEALLHYVTKVWVPIDPQPALVVLVESRSTAYYVASALQESCDRVMVLHPGVALEKMAALMAAEGGGIVVATTGGLREGIDFPNTECLIVYDIGAAAVRERHLPCFDRFSRKTTLTIVELFPIDLEPVSAESAPSQ